MDHLAPHEKQSCWRLWTGTVLLKNLRKGEEKNLGCGNARPRKRKLMYLFSCFKITIKS
jgi:hypothetical protein